MNKISKTIICMLLTVSASTVMASDILPYLDCSEGMSLKTIKYLSNSLSENELLQLEAAWLGNQNAYLNVLNTLYLHDLVKVEIGKRAESCSSDAALLAVLRNSRFK